MEEDSGQRNPTRKPVKVEMNAREQVLFAAGQDFHDLFMCDESQLNLAAIRTHLESVKATLVKLGDAFPATAHLQALHEAQKRAAAQCASSLQIVHDVVGDVMPVGPKLDTLRARIKRASASALMQAVEIAKEFAETQCEAGRAFTRVNVSAERCLAAAGSIDQQIRARDNPDPAWVEFMRKLSQEKRDAAAAGEVVEQLRAAWLETPEYAKFAQIQAAVARINATEPLAELYKKASDTLNNGKEGSASGAAFEQRVAASESLRTVLRICGIDADWFDECERRNEVFPRQQRGGSSRNSSENAAAAALWIDQSKSPHSIRCQELGKPNIRFAQNLTVLEPVVKDGIESMAGVGEVDGLIYDASTNPPTALVWVEAKAHAPDLPKADAQATATLRKMFSRRAVLSAERSKQVSLPCVVLIFF
jgi:hypothetical protein